jgi:hypothetical protein
MRHLGIILLDNGLAVDNFLGEPICYGMQGARARPEIFSCSRGASSTLH